MIIRNPLRRQQAARAAVAGACVSLTAMVLSIVSVIAPTAAPVAAATPGNAQVITPIGEDAADGGKLLDSGDSSTEFSLLLPDGAACTGDSASQDYRIYSYLVGGDIDPTTLEFVGSAGPQPEAYGAPLSGFRQPLYDVFGSPYNAAQTANAEDENGPGMIINIPAFSFAVFESTTNLPLGEYNAGIVCWGPGKDGKLDKYWNVPITVEADASDEGPVGIRWTADQTASRSTTVSLDVVPDAQAEEGEEVTLTATVTPAAAVGDVTFSAGEDEIGTGAVSEGSAALVVDDLAVGDHSLRATFTPTLADEYASSESPALEYEVVAAGQGTTTTTAPGGSTSTTAPPVTTETSVVTPPMGVGGSSSFGPSTGGPLTALPMTGGSISIGLWGVLLVVFGRMAVLLGRSPSMRAPALT